MKDYTLKSAASERELMRIDEKPRYGELKRMIDAQKKREKGLVPLRIDKTTVILVRPENANPEYAAAYDAKVHKTRYIYRSEFKKGNV